MDLLSSRRRFLVGVIIAACLVAGDCHNHANVSVCVPASQTDAQLAACTAILSVANTEEVQFSCVSGRDTKDCFRRLGDGSAAITSASGKEVFTANLDFGVLPILGEGYPNTDDNTAYYSVAVVNKTFCEGPANKTLANLKGLRSSHTGYGRTAGWDYPVGALLASGVMPRVMNLPNVADDAESVAAFFSKVCAPRESSGFLSTNNLPMQTTNGTGAQYAPLCTACNSTCNSQDAYSSYQGVVRALMEGAADVGFTNHTVMVNYSLGGSQAQAWSTRPSSDFRLLCRNGGCANVTDYRSCHIARGPSRAIVASPLLGNPANGSLFTAIQDALSVAALNATWVDKASQINGVPNFLVTTTINRLTKFNTGVRGFFERDTLTALQALNQIPTYFNGSGNATYGRMSFCVGNSAEKDFCLSAARLLNASSLGFGWDCSLPLSSSADCAADVAVGHTDALVAEASQLFTGFRDYKLRAIASEDSGSGVIAAYYSVAVVNQSYCNSQDAAKGLAGLAGKSVCSTGYGRTAGWAAPLGYLFSKNQLNVSNLTASISGDAQAAVRFFGKVCAPGTTVDGPQFVAATNRTQAYPPLCTACSTPSSCNASERYYGYKGAFRGVVEGACTAAFTKDGIIEGYSSGGKFAESWAPNATNYRLLCPGGGCADPYDSAKCSAAKVPSRAVAVRNTFAYVGELLAALDAIVRTPYIQTFIFNKNNNPGSFLFQNDVQSFVPIEVDTLTYLGSTGVTLQSLASLNANVTGIPLRTSAGPATPAASG